MQVKIYNDSLKLNVNDKSHVYFNLHEEPEFLILNEACKNIQIGEKKSSSEKVTLMNFDGTETTN